MGASAGTSANSTVAPAAGASRFGASALTRHSAATSGAESFSSSWQSQLTALGAEATQPEETESALQATTASVAADDEEASTTPIPALATSLRAALTTELGGKIGESATSGLRTQALANRPTSAETQQTAAKTENRRSSSGSLTDATSATRTTTSGKNARLDLNLAQAAPEAVQNRFGAATLVAPVPAVTNPLSSTVAAQAASSATSLSLRLPAGSSPSSSRLPVPSDGMRDAQETLPAGDRLPPAGTTTTASTASQGTEPRARSEHGQSSGLGEVVSQDAATAISSEASAQEAGHPALSGSSLPQVARSTATTSLTGSTTVRGQTAPNAGISGNLASNSASGETVEGKTSSSKGGSALTVESVSTQLARHIDAIAGRPTPGQIPSLAPEAIQSQPTGADACSPGSGSADAPGRPAGNATLPTHPLMSVAPVANRTDVAGTSRTAEPATVRTVHEAGKSGLTQQGIQVHGQPGSTASVDAAATVRDPSVRGALNATDHAAEETNSTGSGLKETFAALDAEGAAGKPTWIHAGAQRAEAGIEDPELGWVSVRADMGSGGVHASLVPGSADAAQALGGHLAGLNSYLSDHHTPVETLTLAAPESGWSGPGAGAGQGQADPSGQNARGNGETSAPANPPWSASSLTAESSWTSPQGSEEMNGNSSTVPWGGTHISVLA